MQKKTLFHFFGILLLSGSLKAQNLEITALNRITLNRNDTVFQFFTIKQPKKIKIRNDQDYYWYVPDTILITRTGFDGKLLHGPYKVFYPDKNIREQGTFKYGTRTGEWKTWYSTGRLKSMLNWKNGKKEGSFEEYNENGKKARSGFYHNDLLSGKLKEYMDNNSIKETEFMNGKPVPEKNENN